MRYAYLFLFLAVTGFSCHSPQAEEEAKTRKPNILFIAVDDLRPELGSYGRRQIHTPNIDRLAAGGTVFTNAYCNVPVCGASRASIMTGMRPRRDRFWDYKTRIATDVPEAVTLHGHFRANGYYTAAMGKVLHHPDDRAADYDEPNWMPGVGAGAGRDYQMPENKKIVRALGFDGRGPAFERGTVADTAYWDGKTAARAMEYLERLVGEDQPFFLAVGFAKPHLPFNAPDKYWQLYDTVDFQLPPTYFRAEGTPAAIHHTFGELRNYTDVPKDLILPEDYARQLIHGYYASTSFTDAQIGKVLAALEASGEAENTIIVLWGDHGWNLGDHTLWCKHTPFNTSLRVPLIVKAPGYPAGRSSALVEFVDVFPTLTKLTGLAAPDQLQGKSLAPLLEDPNRPWSRAVFTRWQEADNITTDRYAYTEWHDGEGTRYARVLFDHQKDSLEVNNLAELPEYGAQVTALSARIDSLRREIAD